MVGGRVLLSPEERRRRWRLILGPDSQRNDQPSFLTEQDAQIDQVLGYLFDREHDGSGGHRRDRIGTLDPSSLHVPQWLVMVRDLFPRSTAESLTKLALERYKLTAILADEETLQKIEPNIDLLRSILAVRSIVPSRLLDAVRRIIRKVVAELREKLEIKVRQHFSGGADRRSPNALKLARNFDVVRTIRRNLKHFQPKESRLVLERPYFFSRIHRQNPWDLFLLVDQSGSMVDSLIHAAVLAGIFQNLRMLRTRLIAFDTSVVDFSDQIGDPVELLLRVQLGGGTDIGQALAYVDPLLTRPKETMVVLITDFYEGGDEKRLLDRIARLVQHGVTALGLAALDDRAEPAYNRDLAKKLAKRGMSIAAMTPDRLAEWVAERIRRR
jgi:Mg-chelatase subunit ChlD